MCGTIQDQGGSGGVLLAACQLILANLPKVVEQQGASSRKVSQYWQVASLKHREVFLSMYITYISVSNSTPLAVTGPHRQLASVVFCRRVSCFIGMHSQTYPVLKGTSNCEQK